MSEETRKKFEASHTEFRTTLHDLWGKWRDGAVYNPTIKEKLGALQYSVFRIEEALNAEIAALTREKEAWQIEARDAHTILDDAFADHAPGSSCATCRTHTIGYRAAALIDGFQVCGLWAAYQQPNAHRRRRKGVPRDWILRRPR